MSHLIRFFSVLILLNLCFSSALSRESFSYINKSRETTKISFEAMDISFDVNEGVAGFMTEELVGSTTDEGFPTLPIYSSFFQMIPGVSYDIDFEVLSSYVIEDIELKLYVPEGSDGAVTVPDYVSYPNENLVLSEPMIMRDIVLSNISVIPFRYHPLIRNVEACFNSSSFAIELARRHGTKLHVLHITTADEFALFSDLQLEEKHITAEACVHHLFFDDSDYEKKGSLIKCNPAIKTQNDRDAIRQAVIDNKIDVIATDHAPHALEDKMHSYFNAASGMPLGQHALISLLEHYHAGVFSLELIVEKASHAVARLFQLEDRGFIREGYWADLVLIDVNKTYTVSEENILYKCGWSPFTGFTFKSSIDTTIVSGHIAYQKGEVDPNPAGKQLFFTR